MPQFMSRRKKRERDAANADAMAQMDARTAGATKRGIRLVLDDLQGLADTIEAKDLTSVWDARREIERIIEDLTNVPGYRGKYRDDRPAVSVKESDKREEEFA